MARLCSSSFVCWKRFLLVFVSLSSLYFGWTNACATKHKVCVTRYKALMSDSRIQKVLTVGDDRSSLSFQNPNQHPITLQSLFSDDQPDDEPDGKHKYWKTLGGKYLAMEDNKQLTLSSKPTTKFLYVKSNRSILHSSETFFLCAIFNDKSYLVSSKNMSTEELGDKSICDNVKKAEHEIKIKKISRRQHRFVTVYVSDSNKSHDNYFSDEIQTFCKQDTEIQH